MTDYFEGIGFLELANWENTFSGKSEPGDYGFDGGQLKGKSAKEVADLKLKEIKNGKFSLDIFCVTLTIQLQI